MNYKHAKPAYNPRTGRIQEQGGASSPRFVTIKQYSGDAQSPPHAAHFLKSTLHSDEAIHVIDGDARHRLD